MITQKAGTLHSHATILVVEDDEMTVRLLKRMLQRAGYRDIHTTPDPFEALALYRELCPDLVMLDLHMPSGEGFVVLEQLRAEAPEQTGLPVLMLTGDTSPEAKHQAFVLGVTEFLTKPLDFLEVRYRVANLLQVRFLYRELCRRSERLDAAGDLRRPVPAPSCAAGLPHTPARPGSRVATTRHSLVARVAASLAGELGLVAEEIERIRWVAHLYRAAAAGPRQPAVPWFERLTAQESERMKSYIREEAKLLFGTPAPELLALAEEVVSARDERWDGSGYPQGLSGEQIPLAARIVAVAEHFADLAGSPLACSAGPARVKLTELVVRGGRRFDPQVVKALVELQARGELDPRE